MKFQNTEVVQAQSQAITARWTPKRQGDKDDGWILDQKVEGLKTSVELGGNKIEFDSTKASNIEGALSDFNLMVGAEFEVTLDSANRVLQIDGRKKIANKLLASRLEGEGLLLAQSIVEDGVSRFAETAFGALPGKPVRTGDSWTRTAKVAGGSVGEFQAEYTYIYEGKEGDLDRIRVEVALKDPSPTDRDGAPFKVKKADVKRSEGAGLVLFDRDRGRVVRQELNLTLEGKLTAVLNGQESEVELSQTQKTTLRTMDANPLQPAAGDDRKEVDRLREDNQRLRDENERLRRQLKAIEEALKRNASP
jgi:hypothetical protein